MITAPISAVLSFCCGIGFAICVSVVFAELHKRKFKAPILEPRELHPCEIRHELISIDTRAAKAGDGSPATILLSRCSRCETRYATIFPGEWTISDFLKQRSDIERLEAMVK